METLGRLYGADANIADYVKPTRPQTLVGVLSLGGASEEVVQRVTEGMSSLPEKPFLVTAIDVGEAHASNSPRSHDRRGTSHGGRSAGGKSDDGRGSGSHHDPNVAASPAAAPSPKHQRTASDATAAAGVTDRDTVGILRSGWVKKHRTQHYGCFVVVEELALLPSTEKVVVETMIANRMDALRHRFKNHSQRILLAIVTTSPAKEAPQFGNYTTWDECASCIRKSASLSDHRYAGVLHMADEAALSSGSFTRNTDWGRSLERLQQSVTDATIKYHADEGKRVKLKLKAPKTHRYPIPRMLTVRIRFKVAWHYEAARDARLAAHNYIKGYEEARKLPMSLETLVAADIIFFRYMQLNAGQLGIDTAAGEIQQHLEWSASKFDASVVTVVNREGFVTSPNSHRALAHLLHTIHMAEAHRRYGQLMLRVHPFEPGDPRASRRTAATGRQGVVRHFNGPLLDAGKLSGNNAGTIQFLYGGALAYQRARKILQAASRHDATPAAAGASSPAGDLLPPAFLGREPSTTGLDALRFVCRIAREGTTWRAASQYAFELASLAMPLVQQLGMDKLGGHLATIMAEHYRCIGDPQSAMLHTAAASRHLVESRLLRDRGTNFEQVCRGDGKASDATIVPYVTVSAAFAEPMYEARPWDAVDDDTNSPLACKKAPSVRGPYARVTMNVHVGTSLPHAVRFSALEIRISRADELPPGADASSGGLAAASSGGLAVRPMSKHTVTVEDFQVTRGQGSFHAHVSPAEPIATAGLYVIEKFTLVCADGARVDVPVPSAEVALAQLHRGTSRDAMLGHGAQAPSMSLYAFPPGCGFPVCRVWSPAPRLRASIRQPVHAVEGERHLVEVRLEAIGGVAVRNGMLRLATPNTDYVEPVVGLDGDRCGPWMTRFGDAGYAQCPVEHIEPGEAVTVPVVLLCRAAGQFTLPLTCTYQVEQLNVPQDLALSGAIALHVVHPVFAHFTVQDSLSVVPPSASSSRQMGGAASGAHLAVPSDHLSSKFAETAEGSAGDEHGTSHLAHSHAGLPPWAADKLPNPPQPKLYQSKQRHLSDGRGGLSVPKVGWGKPFFVACRLTNNLRCRVAVTSIRLEAHESSPMRVLYAPSVDGTELEADDQMTWHCAVAATEMPRSAATRAGTQEPQHVPQLGTLAITMQRLSWDDEATTDGGFEFANKAHASALLQSTFTFEVGMPAVAVEDPPAQVALSVPLEVRLGEAFPVQLLVRNPHPLRPMTVRIGVGDSAVASITQTDNAPAPALALRANAVDLAGRTMCLLSVPPGQSRSVAWRAVGTALGHQSIPAVVVTDKTSGARVHDPSHQHSVFVVA